VHRLLLGVERCWRVVGPDVLHPWLWAIVILRTRRTDVCILWVTVTRTISCEHGVLDVLHRTNWLSLGTSHGIPLSVRLRSALSPLVHLYLQRYLYFSGLGDL